MIDVVVVFCRAAAIYTGHPFRGENPAQKLGPEICNRKNACACHTPVHDAAKFQYARPPVSERGRRRRRRRRWDAHYARVVFAGSVPTLCVRACASRVCALHLHFNCPIDESSEASRVGNAPNALCVSLMVFVSVLEKTGAIFRRVSQMCRTCFGILISDSAAVCVCVFAVRC